MNSGLELLAKMGTLQHVSAYTLIHLARDNGIKLHFIKVEKKDLVKVGRPAIFHAKTKFVFVEDGRPMPNEDYSGYVLSTHVFGQLMPFELAKRISGG